MPDPTPMPDPQPVPPAPVPEALDFLLRRRSHPLRSLSGPAPGRDTLRPLLTAAARVPDHGKLEPWRFIVLSRPALARIAQAVAARAETLAMDPDKAAKAVRQYADSPLAVVVVHVPRPTDRIPAFEQLLSTGAVCLGLVNAALAAGWGANWLTGWATQDGDLCRGAFGLAEGERIAGVVHIGTATAAPADRPRPDLDAITTWAD